MILFTSLTDDDLIQIIDLLVDQINVNLVAKQVKIRLAPDAAKYILEKTCGDRSYGARPLRRALQKYIEDPLSEALIQGIAAAPGRARSLPGRHRHLLPPGSRRSGQREGEAAVTAGDAPAAAPAPGTLLYTF